MVASPATVALIGPPNSGKSALFNRLTGARQRVANYAGVTVDCREGPLHVDGVALQLLDLPGIYRVDAGTAEERVTARVVQGRAGQRVDVAACVVDATNPELGLTLALEIIDRGIPSVVVLTACDLVEATRLQHAATGLQAALGVPVATSSAFLPDGVTRAAAALAACASEPLRAAAQATRGILDRERLAHQLSQSLFGAPRRSRAARLLDAVTLHPVAGPALLLAVLFLLFQAVFSWSAAPSGWIEAGVAQAAQGLSRVMGPGPLRELLSEAVLSGVGGVLVFLPPILVLFAFLVVLEESGYLPRAAFVLDPVMSTLGLSGRSLIPLLSSFACAVPGILAARTIPEPRTRTVTMLLAPLMTCSARLPVYTLLIGAFVPATPLGGGMNLQGLVLFALYAAGVLSAVAVAALAHAWQRGAPTALLMELPAWRRPTLQAIALTLRERTLVFLRRVGGILLALSIVLWALTRFPAPPPDSPHPAIYHTAAGTLGRSLQPLLAPLGFDWQISMALIPGLAAREVVVAALGTVYAAQSDDALAPALQRNWPVPTALALLAWFVFAPQCLSTLVVLRRESGGWSLPLAMSGAYFALAWGAAFVTHQVATALMAGP
jgi:ferrous iron transport protein B